MKKAGVLFPFKDMLQKFAKDPLMTGCWAWKYLDFTIFIPFQV